MLFIFQSETKPDIDRLIEEYSKELTRLCYMILKDAHLAEEAAWDTLYKAYKNYNSFRRESSEKTWISQIAINVCRSYMRKASFKELVSSNYISLAYVSEDDCTSEFTSEDSIALLNAVYSLSEKYKEVILLRYYQQMTVSEIAKFLNEKENTISVRLKRGHEKLNEMLKEEV